jgi:hypothetical protein
MNCQVFTHSRGYVVGCEQAHAFSFVYASVLWVQRMFSCVHVICSVLYKEAGL